MNLALENPIIAGLAGAALVAALILSRGRIVTRLAPALRVVALMLLALAMAGPDLQRSQPGLVTLTDVSDSVIAAPRALERVPAARRLEFAGRVGEAGTERSALEPTQTDLRNALQVASAYRPSRILLVSDGNTTTGDVLAALPDVPVDVLPLPTRANARVADLIAPTSLQPGSTLRAQAVLETTQAARARVLPSLNGRPLPTRTIQLPAGRTSVPVEFTVPSALPGQELELEVRVQVNFDQPTLDDSKVLSLRSNTAPSVLVIGDPAAARLLRAQGFNVRLGTPADVREPFNPQAVVIRTAASDFSLGQLKLLEKYVLEGGGLMLTGGPKAFGLGGWSRTPIEATLPVASDLRTRVDVPLVAMVMVLDRSLSMQGAGGLSGGTKLALAIEGVGNVIELASERDQLGLVTFSDSAKWVFKPMRASENNKLQMIRAAAQIESSGGTILEPAYREAIAALKDTRAAIKHIILLTDGQLADDQSPFAGGSGPPNFVQIARAARDAGITTSSIALGEDADLVRLRAIAGAGGGRFYAAADVDTLPRIFTTEALTATRSLVRTEPVRPTLVRHPLSGSVGSRPPTLTAYVATTLRETGEPILLGLDDEPVLAVTRKGLGRTAALTADLNRDDTFTRWPDLASLIGTVTRWLETAPAPYNLTVSPDGRTAVLDAVTANRYVDGERFELRVGAERLEMTQTGPGRYEARLPEGATGNLVLTRAGEMLSRTRLEPRTRELETTNGLGTLRSIATASGGRVLETLEGYVPARAVSRVSLAPWLALLAGLVLMAELAWRRFRL